MPKIVSDII